MWLVSSNPDDISDQNMLFRPKWLNLYISDQNNQKTMPFGLHRDMSTPPPGQVTILSTNVNVGQNTGDQKECAFVDVLPP